MKGITVLFALYLYCVVGTAGNPSEYSSDSADTEVVGSIIREVRAAPDSPRGQATEVHDLLYAKNTAASDPDNFERYYDSGDKGTVGYLKKTGDKGSDGYKHFDSYHKKDGDKYGYEHHTSFGQGAKDSKEGLQHHSKYTKDDAESEHEEQKQPTHSSYEVSEDVSEHEPVNEEKSAAYEYGGNYEHVGGEGEHYTVGNDAGDGYYGGDAGHYNGGDAGHYTGGKSGHYTGGYENYDNKEGAGDGHYSEGDGQSEKYTSEGDGYTDGGEESEHYENEDDY